jgi:hypothetical protein
MCQGNRRGKCKLQHQRFPKAAVDSPKGLGAAVQFAQLQRVWMVQPLNLIKEPEKVCLTADNPVEQLVFQTRRCSQGVYEIMQTSQPAIGGSSCQCPGETLTNGVPCRHPSRIHAKFRENVRKDLDRAMLCHSKPKIVVLSGLNSQSVPSELPRQRKAKHDRGMRDNRFFA